MASTLNVSSLYYLKCGANLKMAHPGKDGWATLSWGAEVEADYDVSMLNDYEVISIPESKYVVFNSQKFLNENAANHGAAISSVWDASEKYRYAENGFEHNSDIAIPIYSSL